MRDTTWLALAEAVSKESPCSRSKVGAVIVDPNDETIIAIGFNHIPSYGNMCEWDCPRGRMSYEELPQSTPFEGAGQCLAVHAEAMALLRAGERARGARMYVSRAMCHNCSVLAQAAQVTVYWS